MKKAFFLCAIAGFIALVVWFFNDMQQRETLRQERARVEAAARQEKARRERELAERSLAIAVERRLRDKAAEAQSFIQKNGFDAQHAVFIDFSVHSGKKRFFVWNYQKNAVEFSSLVAHGYGNERYRSTQTEIVFSNVNGSYASSLGKYRIGRRAYSQWGINVHYKLHGLENTNSNAFERIIVLHSFGAVPGDELYPEHLPLGYSQGCPVIDDASMRKIDALLKGKSKPLLLWIYY